MGEEEIDLYKLWAILWNNKMKIARITAGFLFLAGSYLFMVPPLYQSTTLLRLKPARGFPGKISFQVPAHMQQQTYPGMEEAIGGGNVRSCNTESCMGYKRYEPAA